MTSSIVIDGKEYISSREAVRVSKYTSDYVGQMARDNRVPSVKKGKGRYVLKEAFLNYAFSQGKLRKGVYLPDPFVFDNRAGALNPIKEVPQALPFSHVESRSNYVYEEDQDELIPTLREKEKEVEQLPLVPVNEIEEAPIEKSSVEIEQPTRFQEIEIPISHDVQARRVPRFAWAIPALAFFLVLGSYLAFTNTRGEEEGFDNPYVAAISIAEDAQAFVEEVLSMVGNAFIGIGRMTTRAGELSNESLSFSEFALEMKEEWDGRHVRVASIDETEPGTNGLVLFPSSHFDSDEERVDHIKESFSDDVRVIPDAHGRSGYIVPLFEDESDERYRYIIVPEED